MTPGKLQECLGCDSSAAILWAPHLTSAMDCFEIDTPTRQAAFLAQVGHESGLLTITEENLRYSAEGLLKIFPKYFDTETAPKYAKHPDMIANRVYANRMGNGDQASGDGWTFRGRGLIQLTGRNNYKACGDGIGLDLIGLPEQLTLPTPAAMSAGWFWEDRTLNQHADSGNFERLTRAINGGLNGLAHRLELWNKTKAALGA